jgi:16S rRNA (adenine1518-N6/adenine1519-N6)-dimethyltransferase
VVKDLPPLKEIIETHELRAKKSLGQNFLLDLNVTDKIARNIVAPAETTFFEIGPGPGGLTRSLLMAGAKKVIAVEFDPRAVAALQSLKDASDGRLDILHADALTTDLKDLCSDEPAAIVANLPYNIATPLLFKWLEQIHANPSAYSHMILMFQKEVADRIVAKPNTKAYGRLSVMAQWLCHCTPLFDLPPSVFSPPPKVTSSVVQFTPKKIASDTSFSTMEMTVKAAFSQRRKMIRSTLKPYLSTLQHLEIKETLRAEDLSIDNFIAIADHIK